MIYGRPLPEPIPCDNVIAHGKLCGEDTLECAQPRCYEWGCPDCGGGWDDERNEWFCEEHRK